MRSKIPALALLSGALFLGACNLLESGSELANLFSVKFSEGSPSVDGQNVTYSGSALDLPSLDKFKFKMVFHVKADNSGNKEKAAFGTDAIKPILNFHINSKSGDGIATPIPAFSVEGGKVVDLAFPIEIPLSVIDPPIARKIINGEAIPYFLTGTVKFDLLEGTAVQKSGTSKLDLTSGEISTRPSGTVTSMLSKLL